jgi:uncharacterized membrane protein
MVALTILVHWLHVLGAIVWAGSQLFLALAVWPALLQRPESDARTFVGALMPTAARILGPAGMLTIVTGLLRGTVFGPMRSWAALATPYGITFLVSILIVAALTVRGGRLRTRLGPRVFGDGAFPDRARAFLDSQRRITVGALAVLVGAMVLMRFGA